MIPSYDEARDLLRRVTGLASAPEVEIRLEGGAEAMVRFQGSATRLHGYKESIRLTLKLGLGPSSQRHFALASTTDLSDGGLADLVSQAKRLAHLAPAVGYTLPPTDPAPYRPLEFYDEGTEDAGPAYLSSMVSEALFPCLRRGLDVSGSLRVAVGGLDPHGRLDILALANSYNLYAYQRCTRVRMDLIIEGGKGRRAWAAQEAISLRDLKVNALVQRCMERSLAGHAPLPLPSGPTRALFEPPAMAALIWAVADSMNGLAVHEGRSMVSGRLGNNVFGPYISLWDDPYHLLHWGRPFDGEGLPAGQIKMVRLGKPLHLIYDRETARQLGTTPTGHGRPRPSLEGPRADHPLLEQGRYSQRQLRELAGEAILVPRLVGLRWVDHQRGIFAAHTGEPVLRLKGGQVVGTFAPARLHGHLGTLLKGIRSLSQARRAEGAVVSAAIIDGVRFEATA